MEPTCLWLRAYTLTLTHKIKSILSKFPGRFSKKMLKMKKVKNDTFLAEQTKKDDAMIKI